MQLPKQCKKYIKLNEASRNIKYGKGSNCDAKGRSTKINGSARQWYRFFKPAGTRIPDRPPSLNGNKCGTHATGWLQGGHPESVGQVVSRRICFSNAGEKCWSKSYCQVANCGSFFVYQLPSAPSCSFRYCATNKGT